MMNYFAYLVFGTGSQCVGQADFELVTPLPPKCKDFRGMPLSHQSIRGNMCAHRSFIFKFWR